MPDLCWLEISSVLCRQINRALLISDEVSELFADIERLPLRTKASRDLCVSAMQLSQEHSISVYDATYLAMTHLTALWPGSRPVSASCWPVMASPSPSWCRWIQARAASSAS